MAVSVVPVYHSLPGAPASLFLDFDGNYEAEWNITTPKFDMDGDPSTWNSEEQKYINDVWQIVKEDFAPFNIDVTTEQPAVLAPGVPQTTANRKALRVAIGGDYTILGNLINVGSGTAGYAFKNSFSGNGANTVYAIPTTSTGTIRPAIAMGTVASHETGHAMGLDHCNNIAGIMSGAVFRYEDVFWTADINEQDVFQDDMAILSNATNGFGYRNDDIGNSIGTSAALANSNGMFAASGIIGAGSDVDVWSFNPGTAESFHITLQGSSIGQNLDAVLEVLDSSGNILRTSNPADSNDASLDLDAPGITRYLRVRSTGAYGRIGQYTLTAVPASPGIDVIESKTLLTSEDGTTDSFDVALKSRPAHDVILTVTSTNIAEGIPVVSQRIFTPGNWFIPQTFTVAGVNDFDLDDAAQNSFVISAASSDLDYSQVAPTTISAINADNDAPGWVKSIHAIDSQSTVKFNDIKVDANGNIYLAGEFTGSVDFDSGSGQTIRTSSVSRSGFLGKYDANGGLTWVQTYGADSLTQTVEVVLDGAGNSYIATSWSGVSLKLGATTLTNAANNSSNGDVALAKLDSNGQFVWAKSWGGASSDSVFDMGIDPSGNIIVAGNFQGVVDFNPASGTTSRTSAGGSDIFVSTFNNAGSFISVAIFGGVSSDNVTDLSISPTGDLYLTGQFTGSASFGSQTLVALGTSDNYLLKLNNSGAVQWIRQAFDPISSSSTPRIATSPDGSVYWASPFKGSVHFGSGTPTLTGDANVYQNVFVTRWNATGALLAHGQFTGTDLTGLSNMEVDSSGMLAVTGRMDGEIDLDLNQACPKW